MKRTVILSLALCLALAGCAGPAAPAASSGPAGAASAESAAAAAPAGAVRWLDESDGGCRYTLELPVNNRDYDNQYSVLIATDYAARAQRPVCGRAGCAHDSPDCGAWLRRAMGVDAIGADGGRLFLCYGQGGLLESGDAAADAELAAWYAANEGAAVAHVEVVEPDGSRRRLAEIPELDSSEAGSLRLLAVDDASLYLLQHSTADPYDAQDDTHALLAVDLATGALTTLTRWEDRPYHDIVMAKGRSLYALDYDLPEGESSVRGGQLERFDLDSRRWAGSISWENEIGPDTSEGLPGAGNFVGLCGGTGGRCLLRQDQFTGTLASLDPDTGAETVLCRNLPAAAPDTRTSWQCGVLASWYTVQVRDADGAYRLFLVPRAGGEAAEVTQRQYVSARGTEPIYLWDEWQGEFFCHVDFIETPFQDIDKDGTLYHGTRVEDVLALLPAADLLAGSTDYIPIRDRAGCTP